MVMTHFKALRRLNNVEIYENIQYESSVIQLRLKPSNLCQTSLIILKSKAEFYIPVSVLSFPLNQHMAFNYHFLRGRLCQ